MDLKPATTFNQQLELLRDKNIIITDEASCIDFLSKVNYYRLSGYYLPYIDRATGSCFQRTYFARIVQIYRFDTALRNLVFSAIERIEIYLRAQFANYHALKYGPEGYLDPNNYNEKHDNVSFQEYIEKCKKENEKTLIVVHHNNKYDGHFPLWVIIEFFSMGTLSYFYRGMKNNDKAKLANKLYGTNYQTIDSWLRCITDLRNYCAHYARIYYVKFPAIPRMPTGESYKPSRRIFAQLYLLKLMYPDKANWDKEFLTPLKVIMSEYSKSISLNHIDFPDNWESLLK